MKNTNEKLLPGTAMPYTESGQKGFEKIEMLISATGGLSLSQVCAVTGLEGSTIQNWVKRGWVEHPNGKKYGDVHIARILIINALKECIKLEHIALLMRYVNAASGGEIIKESELFNFLCDALDTMGHTDDLSRVGVEAVVEEVVQDCEPEAVRERVGKALTVMIYACVCTDVKRRTEAMMEKILHEHENPEQSDDDVLDTEQIADTPGVNAEEEPPEVPSEAPPEQETSKSSNRPWYFRKGSQKS